MRKLHWIVAGIAGFALLNKRRTQLGWWSAATESVKGDLAQVLADRNDPNAPSIWSRLFGSKNPPAAS